MKSLISMRLWALWEKVGSNVESRWGNMSAPKIYKSQTIRQSILLCFIQPFTTWLLAVTSNMDSTSIITIMGSKARIKGIKSQEQSYTTQFTLKKMKKHLFIHKFQEKKYNKKSNYHLGSLIYIYIYIMNLEVERIYYASATILKWYFWQDSNLTTQQVLFLLVIYIERKSIRHQIFHILFNPLQSNNPSIFQERCWSRNPIKSQTCLSSIVYYSQLNMRISHQQTEKIMNIRSNLW